jgi:CRISPR-associated endonuclease/helicase Cas3
MNPNPLLAYPSQSLAAHLEGASNLAEKFAASFGACSHGHIAGLLHDLGKVENVFQERMAVIQSLKKDPGGKEPHAHHGAATALEHQLWHAAFAVNGHHVGLHNRSDLQKICVHLFVPLTP